MAMVGDSGMVPPEWSLCTHCVSPVFWEQCACDGLPLTGREMPGAGVNGAVHRWIVGWVGRAGCVLPVMCWGERTGWLVQRR